MLGLVRQGQEGMRAGSPLVHAVVAEAPVSQVAQLAAPKALISPGEAMSAEVAALQALQRILGRERPPALGSTRDDLGLEVAVRCQHVRLW